jgi:hypothetical protein
MGETLDLPETQLRGDEASTSGEMHIATHGNAAAAQTRSCHPARHARAMFGRRGRSDMRQDPVDEHDERNRRRFPSPTARRLGPVECALLALIALSVAITVVMAIVNP